MCLLITAEGKRPSEELLRRAARANSDGAGIAWIEGELVRWEKNVDPEVAIRLAARVPMPFLVHFRWATVGGVNTPLCHPFPVSRGVSTQAAGRARAVLAHNGHWHGWEDHSGAIAARAGVRVPKGPWSDSRAIAWVAHLVGEEALELIDEKVAILDKDGIRRYGTGWHDLSKKGRRLHLSNRSDLSFSGTTSWNYQKGWKSYGATKKGTAKETDADGAKEAQEASTALLDSGSVYDLDDLSVTLDKDLDDLTEEDVNAYILGDTCRIQKGSTD